MIIFNKDIYENILLNASNKKKSAEKKRVEKKARRKIASKKKLSIKNQLKMESAFQERVSLLITYSAQKYFLEEAQEKLQKSIETSKAQLEKDKSDSYVQLKLYEQSDQLSDIKKMLEDESHYIDSLRAFLLEHRPELLEGVDDAIKQTIEKVCDDRDKENINIGIDKS